MKKLILLFFVFAGLFTSAQQKLYYFVTNNESLVGVKDEKGKIIIPAEHYNFSEKKNKEQVEGEIIYLIPLKKSSNQEPNSFGVAYDRKGKVAFIPFNADNGWENVTEGLVRYVKNGKMGFVDRYGKTVISAKFDYVSSFDYGIAKYCNGCVWDKSKDIEHPELKGGKWGIINTKGEELTPSVNKQSEKDQRLDSTQYLPYQFSYTSDEQKIVDSFNNMVLISKAYFVNHYSPMDENERALRFEIVEKPSASFPYYHVKLFSFTNKRGYYGDYMHNFYVSKDGKKYYNLYYDGSLIPLDKWLKNYIQEAKDYLKKNPDALYKF